MECDDSGGTMLSNLPTYDIAGTTSLSLLTGPSRGGRYTLKLPKTRETSDWTFGSLTENNWVGDFGDPLDRSLIPYPGQFPFAPVEETWFGKPKPACLSIGINRIEGALECPRFRLEFPFLKEPLANASSAPRRVSL